MMATFPTGLPEPRLRHLRERIMKYGRDRKHHCANHSSPEEFGTYGANHTPRNHLGIAQRRHCQTSPGIAVPFDWNAGR